MRGRGAVAAPGGSGNQTLRARGRGYGVVTVHMHFTGDVWMRMGGGHMDFEFEGTTLGDLLDAFFARYPVRDLLLDEAGHIRFRSRIAVNGRFSDTVQQMQTPVSAGDTVVLMRPGLGAR